MLYAGIDYSINGTGICIFDDDLDFNFQNCNFYYMTNKKKLGGQMMKNVRGFFYNGKEKEDIDRYNDVSDWAMEIIKDVSVVGLEGYSMGSKGQVFNIAENTAILKYKMNKAEKILKIYAPTNIKKYIMDNTNLDLTGIKKNAVKKDVIYNIFVDETGIDINKIITPNRKKNISSPISDIVDSYYICKKVFFDRVY